MLIIMIDSYDAILQVTTKWLLMFTSCMAISLRYTSAYITYCSALFPTLRFVWPLWPLSGLQLLQTIELPSSELRCRPIDITSRKHRHGRKCVRCK